MKKIALSVIFCLMITILSLVEAIASASDKSSIPMVDIISNWKHR